MKLIEVHYCGEAYSLNVDYIIGIVPGNSGCEVFSVGDKKGDNWNTDECYEEVMRLIKEASDGKEQM